MDEFDDYIKQEMTDQDRTYLRLGCAIILISGAVSCFLIYLLVKLIMRVY